MVLCGAAVSCQCVLSAGGSCAGHPPVARADSESCGDWGAKGLAEDEGTGSGADFGDRADWFGQDHYTGGFYRGA